MQNTYKQTDQHAGFISDWFSWQVKQKVATASLTVAGESWSASKHTVAKARQHKVLSSDTLHSKGFWGFLPMLHSSVSPAVPAGLQDPCLIQWCWWEPQCGQGWHWALLRAGTSLQERFTWEDHQRGDDLKGWFSLLISRWFVQCRLAVPQHSQDYGKPTCCFSKLVQSTDLSTHWMYSVSAFLVQHITPLVYTQEALKRCKYDVW